MTKALKEALAEAEIAFPYLRLMQLIGNIYGDVDLYYLRDDELASAIRGYIAKHES